MDKKTYSVYLSRALDALGFSYRCIKQRQKSWEICGESLSNNEDENITDIIAGSKAEGVSRMLEGDYDLMVSLNDFPCFGSVEDMEKNMLASISTESKDEISNESTHIIYSRTGTGNQEPFEKRTDDHGRTILSKGSFKLKTLKKNNQIRGIDERDERTGHGHTINLSSEADVCLGNELNINGSLLNSELDVKECPIHSTLDRRESHLNSELDVEECPGYSGHYLKEDHDQPLAHLAEKATQRNMRQSSEDTAVKYDGVFLMDTENVSAGYTRLKVVHLDEIKLLNSFTLEGKAVVYAKAERNGESILSSERFVTKAYEVDEDEDTQTVAGPAGRSLASNRSVCDTDSVYSLPCVCKRFNHSWSKRERKFDWPCKELIDEISRLDGHIVPVGFKGSETSGIEWRICYTLSEIKLVKSFNETQIKLHALLKIVGKSLIQTKCPDITSYILKNVLLWMVEKISPENFEIENLYGLLKVALKFLRKTIRKRCLPNYMIPERNLFLGKLPEDERIKVLKVLDELITDRFSFIERYEELEMLSKHIHMVKNDPDLIEYMELNREQLETVFRQNWREVWEDRIYNLVPICIKECTSLKAMVAMCELLGTSSKTKELVIEKVFWWITGRKEDKNDGKGSDDGEYVNPYWCWNDSGDIEAYEPYLLSVEQLNEFFLSKTAKHTP